MVAAVRHHHVPRGLGGDGEALGSVQRAAPCVHVGQEGAELVKHLDPEHEDKMTDETFPWTTGTGHPPGVPPVRHQDVVLAVHRHARRSVELTVALACTNVLHFDEISSH